MKTIPLPGFCGPTYLAATPVLDASRAINLYPEPGIATSKNRMALIGRPGFFDNPYVTLAQSPVRALWAGNNRLFAVGGTHFYEISTAGSVLTDFGAMSGSAGTGYASAIANGTQLLVFDSSAARVYNALSAGPSINPVQMGGVDLRATALEYLDGFYIVIATGASLAGTNPNQINVSANGNGTSWNPLDFVIRTGSADLTNGLAVLNSLLWIFGQKIIEIWYNAGNPLFPFARVNGGTINLGLMSPASIVKFYNTLMWLGSDDRGYAQFYMAQGTNPVRVSNFAIENLINQQTSANLTRTWSYGYQEEGHTFYVATVMDAGFTPTLTVAYDLTTGLWHERTYAGSYPVSFASVPGFLPGVCNFAGDSLSGMIWQTGIQYPKDGIVAATPVPITYTRTAPHVSDRNKWIRYPYFELDGEFGTAAPILDYSNDGGRTFNGFNYPLQQAQDQGAPGTFRRFYHRQLGRSRDRVFKVTIQDSVNLIRMVDAYIGVNPGDEQ